MPDLTEFQTRLKRIDVRLKQLGWDVKDRKKVREEIDTKQSDFIRHDYKTVEETLKNDLESKYADYILLGSAGETIALIEAKRFSKDPLLTAKRQAEEYAKDIISQTKKPVFIFLTNGEEIWFWNYPYEAPRMVRAFMSLDDLETRRWQNEHKTPLTDYEIRPDITDRPKCVECAKRIIEHLNRGHRKALLVMATGTGKTRTSMAIIDILLKHHWAKRILFLTDRKSLRRQAYAKGFKQFFPEEGKDYIFSGKIDKTKRLYAATLQTMSECYQEFSPGFFDVIFSDEAHRSIYDKWKEVFTYFDSIQIGLTATPRESFETDEMRDTFRFFECNERTPTALYEYRDAVRDGVLVDFKKHIFGAQTHFQIHGLSWDDLTQNQKDELMGKGFDPENIDFEGSEFEKKFVTTGTNEEIVREFMDNAIMDATGTVPAKTIIFAMTKKHARRLWEAMERLYPEYGGKLAQVIVSEDSVAQKTLETFEMESFPRVAISVDMLDTGVDIPEVCNLVFAKPIFSRIKFWQMVGRGTRANETCGHSEWLPENGKKYFKIFDFFKNFDYFKMKPEGEQPSASEALPARIFRVRIGQLERFVRSGDLEKVKQLRQRLLRDIQTLPKESASLQSHISKIEKAESADFWERRGLNPFEFLKKDILPLMRNVPNVNLKEASFVLKCEQLSLAIIEKKKESVESLSRDIAEMLERLPESIHAVGEKSALLSRCRRNDFWNKISYEDSQMLIAEFTSLIKYMETESRPMIIVDMHDFIEQRTLIEFGPEGETEPVKQYREKVEKVITELAHSHPTIKKILANEQITDADIEALEKTLNSPGLHFTEDVLGQFYKGSFIKFIKEVLGLVKEEAPDETVKKAFDTYMIEHNKAYSANQLNFIRTLRTVFTKEGHIDMGRLWEAPFSNLGASPTELFPENELNEWLSLCKKLEKEI